MFRKANKGLDFEEYKKQEMDFMEFVYAKAGEFINNHYDHIENVSGLYWNNG